LINDYKAVIWQQKRGSVRKKASYSDIRLRNLAIEIMMRKDEGQEMAMQVRAAPDFVSESTCSLPGNP